MKEQDDTLGPYEPENVVGIATDMELMIKQRNGQEIKLGEITKKEMIFLLENAFKDSISKSATERT